MLVTVTTATLTSYKQHLEHPRFITGGVSV